MKKDTDNISKTAERKKTTVTQHRIQEAEKNKKENRARLQILQELRL